MKTPAPAGKFFLANIVLLVIDWFMKPKLFRKMTNFNKAIFSDSVQNF